MTVAEIEGGSPERDGGGEEEEGQVWGNSMSLNVIVPKIGKFLPKTLYICLFFGY